MLLIRKEQFAALGESRWREFERRVCAEMYRCFPLQCGELGRDQAARRVQTSIGQARSYGFELEDDILRYVYLTFGLGPEFPGSPQYPWAAAILEHSDFSPHTKADLLMQHGMDALGIVPPEPEAEHEDAPAELEPTDDEPEEPQTFDGIVVTDDDEVVPEFEEAHEPMLSSWNEMPIEDEPGCDNSADDIRE